MAEGHYPFNPYATSVQQTAMEGVQIDRMSAGRLVIPAASCAAPDIDIVHAAVADTGEAQTVVCDYEFPWPRSVTATAGGTGTDIKAIAVIVNGEDEDGNAFSAMLPAFTVNSPGTVESTQVFKKVTSVYIPAHDGTGATTSIGSGSKLGLADKLPVDTVLNAYLNGVREATRPTVGASPTDLKANWVDLDSALDGHEVQVTYLV